MQQVIIQIAIDQSLHLVINKSHSEIDKNATIRYCVRALSLFCSILSRLTKHASPLVECNDDRG